MAWTIPNFSRSQVDKAGRFLLVSNWSGEEHERALAIVNNWRSSHSWPLNTLRIGLAKNALRIDPNAVIGQRTKRLNALYNKLRKARTMRLTQMQDLGGCRAVLTNVKAVYALADQYVNNSKFRHELLPIDNYLENPTALGYRGIHLIYSYRSDKIEAYNKLLIEIQLRSQFQHAWATAVEIVDRFKWTGLKSGHGNREWQRFFALMGGYIAQMEGTMPVPNVPTTSRELTAEIKHLSAKLKVEEQLSVFGATTMMSGNLKSEGHYYVLKLDTKSRELSISVYQFNQLDQASNELIDKESETPIGSEDVETVLVSARSLAELKKAFPNYFADTMVFIGLLRKATNQIERKKRKLWTPGEVRKF